MLRHCRFFVGDIGLLVFRKSGKKGADPQPDVGFAGGNGHQCGGFVLLRLLQYSAELQLGTLFFRELWGEFQDAVERFPLTLDCLGQHRGLDPDMSAGQASFQRGANA